MYASFTSILMVALVACWASSSQAFAPIQYVVAPRTATVDTSSALDAEKKGKKDDIPDFLKGGGARITIRQDEDNAMWVDEPKKKDAKSAPKAKGKAAPPAEKKPGFKFPFF